MGTVLSTHCCGASEVTGELTPQRLDLDIRHVFNVQGDQTINVISSPTKRGSHHSEGLRGQHAPQRDKSAIITARPVLCICDEDVSMLICIKQENGRHNVPTTDSEVRKWRDQQLTSSSKQHSEPVGRFEATKGRAEVGPNFLFLEVLTVEVDGFPQSSDTRALRACTRYLRSLLHREPSLLELLVRSLLNRQRGGQGCSTKAKMYFTSAYKIVQDGLLMPVLLFEIPDGSKTLREVYTMFNTTGGRSIQHQSNIQRLAPMDNCTNQPSAIQHTALPVQFPLASVTANDLDERGTCTPSADYMAALTRGFALLSKVPCIVTLVDLETGPAFQNTLSERYFGLLSHGHDAPKSATSFLQLLLPHQPNVALELLQSIRSGNTWKRVLLVPRCANPEQPVGASMAIPSFKFWTSEDEHNEQPDAANSGSPIDSLCLYTPPAAPSMLLDVTPPIMLSCSHHQAADEDLFKDESNLQHPSDTLQSSMTFDANPSNLFPELKNINVSTAVRTRSRHFSENCLDPLVDRTVSEMGSQHHCRVVGYGRSFISTMPNMRISEITRPSIDSSGTKDIESFTRLMDHHSLIMSPKVKSLMVSRTRDISALSQSPSRFSHTYQPDVLAQKKADIKSPTASDTPALCSEPGTSTMRDSRSNRTSSLTSIQEIHAQPSLDMTSAAATVQDAGLLNLKDTGLKAFEQEGSPTSPYPRRNMTSYREDILDESNMLWHEIEAASIQDPVSGRQMMLLIQTDITDRTLLEMTMASMTETQLSMLSQMFPRHVLEYMVSDSTSSVVGNLASSHTDVTIMFMDIVGFTSMSKEVPPDQVMVFLNSLFTLLDDLIDQHDVYKVETAGDCYIVAGNLVNQDNEGFFAIEEKADPKLGAERVMAFAKAVLRCSKTVPMPHNGEQTIVRIGLHTGPVVTGLIGTKLPKFSVFGDTMNTASRMESTSRPGCIQVSSETMKLLTGHTFQPSGGVEVKGKGHMETFLWSPVDHPQEQYQNAEEEAKEAAALISHIEKQLPHLAHEEEDETSTPVPAWLSSLMGDMPEGPSGASHSTSSRSTFNRSADCPPDDVQKEQSTFYSLLKKRTDKSRRASSCQTWNISDRASSVYESSPTCRAAAEFSGKMNTNEIIASKNYETRDAPHVMQKLKGMQQLTPKRGPMRGFSQLFAQTKAQASLPSSPCSLIVALQQQFERSRSRPTTPHASFTQDFKILAMSPRGSPRQTADADQTSKEMANQEKHLESAAAQVVHLHKLLARRLGSSSSSEDQTLMQSISPGQGKTSSPEADLGNYGDMSIPPQQFPNPLGSELKFQPHKMISFLPSFGHLEIRTGTSGWSGQSKSHSELFTNSSGRTSNGLVDSHGNSREILPVLNSIQSGGDSPSVKMQASIQENRVFHGV